MATSTQIPDNVIQDLERIIANKKVPLFNRDILALRVQKEGLIIHRMKMKIQVL